MRLFENTDISLQLKLAILKKKLTGIYGKPEHLHTAQFADTAKIAHLYGKTLDGEHLLLGAGDYGHILRIKSREDRRELGNVLVVGRTRCGKGLFANSQILTWPHSLIVNDIKGELYKKTGRYRAKLGPVRVFDPTGYGHTFDPFLGKVTEDELRIAAINLLFRPDEGENAIFTNRATTMLTQLFLAARLEEGPLLPYVQQALYAGPVDTARRLHAISVHYNRYPNLATRFLDMSLSDMLHKNFDDRFFISCWSTLTHRMDPLLTDVVIRSFGGSDFTAGDIIQGTKPVTLYLRWPEHVLMALAPLVRLVWCSLIDEMMRTYDLADDKTTCRPVLLLVDEAGRTAIPMLSEYATTAVGRGISIWMAIQSLSQLEAVYGLHRADIIRDNMDTQIFYRPANHKTAKYLQDCLGDETGWAQSETLRDGEETSQGRSERPVPLLSSQEVKQLGNEEILIFHDNLPPIRARRMDFRGFPLLQARMQEDAPEVPALSAIQQPVPPVQGTGEEAEFVNPEHYVQ